LGIVSLNLEGRLDMTTSEELHKRMGLELEAGRKYFIFNLSAVSFIDSTGMAAMLKLLKQVRQAGGDIRLVSTSTASIQRILYLTRFDKVFDIYSDVEDALQSYGDPPEPQEDESDEAFLQPDTGIVVPFGLTGNHVPTAPEPMPPEEMAGSSEPRRIVTATTEIEEHIVRIVTPKLVGTLSTHTSTGLKLRVQNLLLKGVSRFVVDFSEVEFVDNTTLSMLGNTLQQLHRRGGSLKLVSANDERILQILAASGLDQAFEVYPDTQKALDAFAPLL
jgi:anti-sigma B factor antagonist